MPSIKSRREMFAREAAHFRKLYDRIGETYRSWEHSAAHRAEWEAACAGWYAYRGPLNAFIGRAYEERPYSDPELVEQAIAFLEEDPWFFRSGYHKARILDTLKRTTLQERQRQRLRAVLLDAVLKRATREYRRYCRLAAVLADEELVRALQRLAAGPDGAQAARARLMLLTIRHGPAGRR